jgi:hypothetical protein
LLDLDGVINACPRNPNPPPGIYPASDWISVAIKNSHDEKPWPILAAKTVVTFINKIDLEGLATVLWHSTWQKEANLVADAIGLNNFDVLDAPEYEGWRMGSRGWWKLPAARRALDESGGHLVWTDDDAAPPHLPNGERRIWRDAGALVVAPNPYQGLAIPNLDRIWFYLTGDETQAWRADR